MSFALSFYEIFSYAIPGTLYILVANVALQLFDLPHMDLAQMPGTLGFLVLVAVMSYLAGHIFEPFGYRWSRLFNRQGIDKEVLAGMKQKYPGLNIEFDPQDRRVLFSFIKHNNPALTEYLDQFHATGVFLHNVSFGLFLFALTQLAYVFRTGELLKYGLGAFLGLLLSFIAVKRSAAFNRWYSLGIFEQALHYGASVEAMFKAEWSAKEPPEPAPPPAPTRKPKTRAKASSTTTSKIRASTKKAA